MPIDSAVLNEVARVDTPAGYPVLEIVRRNDREFIRWRAAHKYCGSCHILAGGRLCRRCSRLAKIKVPALLLKALVRVMPADPRSNGVPVDVRARIVLARFFSHTRRRANGCLEWCGGRDKDGYGKFSVFGSTIRASRFIFELLNGTTKKFVLHRCDNPPCVEEHHLFPGTVVDNSRDMCAKNRAPRGERGGNARLTAQQVRVIRDESTRVRWIDLARRYRVSKSCIWAGIKRHSWRHIP